MLLKDVTDKGNGKKDVVPLRKDTKSRDSHKREQLKLDLLPFNVECKLCGMSYNRTSADDQNLHRKYHKQVTQGIIWKSQPLDQIIAEFEGGCVLRCADPRSHRIARIFEVVNRDLGAVEETGLKLAQVFAYIKDNKCLALVVCRPVSDVYRVNPSESESSSLSHSAQTTTASFGVSRVWTSRNYRRQHFATRLLDIAAKNWLFGVVIDKDDVCFSPVSHLGKYLAQNWTGRLDFKIYKEI